MKKKKEFDTYEGNLRFDNLNFKLAVLQYLIFDKKVFSPQYHFEDFEEWCYAEELSDDELEERKEKYIEEALLYFTYLKVPKHLAGYVTELQIAPGDDIYYIINPEWSGEDEFQVNQISEREISQFPKLRSISFWYMSERVKELQTQLKKHRIQVCLGVKDSHKSASPVLAFVCMVAAAILMGSIGGMLFLNRYQDVEVTWSEEKTEDTPEESMSDATDETVETDATDAADETDVADETEEGLNRGQNYIEEQKESLKKIAQGMWEQMDIPGEESE